MKNYYAAITKNLDYKNIFLNVNSIFYNFKNIKVLFFFLFFLSNSTLFAQGTNCGNATAITIGNCATNDNISDTNQTAPNISGCSAGTFRREGWYTFTVTGGPLNLTITGETTDGNLFLQLISSSNNACSGTLTQIACANNDNTNNSAQIETISTTLNNGTYYVKVVSTRTGGMNGDMYLSRLCVTIDNDVCSGAITLTSNTSCTPTTGSTIGATDNNETGDCTNGTERAVWYQFTAVATTHVVTVTGIAGFDAVIGALTTCGVNTRPTGGGCTDVTDDGGIETMTLTGLTIGQTYKIQVHDYNGDRTANAFTICVTHTCPTVGTPTAITVSAGTEPTCQLANGTTTTTYAATATNSTGFNWSLSNPAAGTINATTGVMTWADNFSGTVDIQVTANGCNGPSTQVVRTVTITPTVGTPTAITVSSGTEPTCQLPNGTTTTTYGTTATNSTGFNWSLSNAAAGNINATTGVMTWANGFSGTVDIQVTANGCNGPSSQVVRTVTITPTVGTPTAITVSSGTEPTCQLPNGTTTTTYGTTATNSTGFNWTLSNAAAGNINATTGEMTWADNFSGTVDIQVTANGCNGPSSQVVKTVTVNPNNLGVSAASASPTLCINTALVANITHSTTNATGIQNNGVSGANGLPAGVTATWSSNTITISGTPTANGVFNYSIPLVGGCGNVNATGTITVRANSTVSPASSTPTLCINTTLTNITHTTTLATGFGTPSGLPLGTSISWSSNTITISGTPSNAGVYNYSIPVIGCGTVTATGTITVEDTVGTTGSITGSNSVCQGQTGVVYTVPSIPNATNYVWNLPTGATITSGANTNSITVSFDALAVSGDVSVYGSNSCGDGNTSILPITVNPLPDNAGTISGTATVCQGQTGVVYNVPAITNASSYIWTVPTGATIVSGGNETITVDFATNATSGNITVRGNNTCGNGVISADYPVTVDTLSEAPASISGTTTICEGTSTTLTLVGGTQGTGATAEWFSGSCGGISAGTGNSINVSPTSTTTYYVRYNGSCNVTACASVTINVNPLPIAAGTITGTATVCQGQTNVTYTVPNITNATGYVWNLPSGATISSGANTNSVTVNFATNATSGNVSVYGTNSCGNGIVSADFAVTVNPLPDNAGIISGTATVCQGQTGVVYTVPTIANALNYNWTLPTGATIVSGANTNSITVNFSGTATSGNITVQGSNACGNGVISANYPVTVNIPSVMPTSISGTTAICEGVSTTLTLNGGTQGTGATAEWFSGSCGGTSVGTGNSITVSPTTTTTYYVRYSGDCNTTLCASATVIVSPLPVAAGTISGAITVCQGQEGVSYSIPAIANVASYVWTLPSGATITTGANTRTITVDFATNALSGNITVYGQNSCGTGATATLAVTVNISPLIVNNYTSTICSGLTATVTPTNGGGNIVPLATTYSWGLPTFSGVGVITGATAQTGQSSFSQTLTNTTNTQQTAVYNVTATTGGCSATVFNITVYVNPRPAVAVSPASPPNVETCSGATITLTPSNPNGISGSISYNWSRTTPAGVSGLVSGSGLISGSLTNSNSASTDVIYTITATSAAGCASISPATVTVRVHPTPTATISNPTQTICSESLATINLINPTVTGATTTYSISSGSNANVTGSLTPLGSSISGTLTNTTNTTQVTTFTISAIANGCTNTIGTATITVTPKPTVLATLTTPASICSGDAVNINLTNPNGVAGTTYEWTSNNPGAGIASGSSGTGNIAGTLTNNGTANITVTFTIRAVAAGCNSNDTTVSITVRPRPQINVTNNNQSICHNTAMTAMNISTNLTGTTTYSWTRDNGDLTTGNIRGIAASGTGNLPTTISGTLTNNATSTQTTTFTITATNTNGCTNTATTSVTVYAPLIAPIIGIPQQVCNSQTPALIYMTTPISGGSGTYSYQWQRTNDPGTPASWTNVPNTPTIGTNNTYQPPTADYYYRLIVTDNNCNPTQSVTSSNNVYIDAIGGLDGLGGIIDEVSLSSITSPICNGSLIPAFTASITHTFLSSVKFLWSVNNSYITPTSGGPVGNTSGGFFPTTSYTFSSFLSNNLTDATVSSVITVTPRFNNSCNSAPATATIQIRPTPKVSSISTANQTICSGGSTSIAVTGNITDAPMTFNWQIVGALPAGVTASSTSGNSGSIPAGNTFNLAITLNNTSAITQPLTIRFTPNSNYSSVNCSGISSDIIINVAPAVTGTITSNQTICNNSTPAQLNLSSTTGLSLSYLWQSSIDGTNFTNITPSQTGSTYNPPALTQSTWYRVHLISAATGSLNCPADTNIVKITVNNITPGTISSSQTVCAPTSSTIALTGTAAIVPAANTGSVITYQWENSTNGCSGPWTTITTDNIANLNYNIPVGLNTTTYFRRKDTSTLNGVSCLEYSNCIIITPNNVTAGTLSSDQTICQNDVPAQLTLLGSTTGATYQWERSTNGCSGTWISIPGETNSTFTPPSLTTTTYYRVSVTSTVNSIACTVYSNCVTITVNPAVNAGTINNNQTICYGSNPAEFTGTIVAGGTYQWQNSIDGVNFTNIASATNANYDDNTSITQITYYRRITFVTTNTVTCQANSNVISVTVNHITSAPVITGNQSACNVSGVTALSITTPATANGTITYRWQISTTGCSGSWTDIFPAATGTSYTPTALTATTHYRVKVISTLNAVACTDVFSNCVEVTFTGKEWNGSVSTDWNNPNNWTPNGIPSAIHCVTIPNVTNDPIIQGTNYDAFAYNLSILAGGKLEINSTNSITVTDFVNVASNALFDIKNNASLVQINNSAINTGNIRYNRTSRPMTRWAYVYWGTPVEENVISQIPSQFDYRYRWQSGTINGSWQPLTSTTPGEGFITRVKNMLPFSTGTGTVTFPFIGKPNNGIVNVNVDSYDNSSLNTGNSVLLANPYPSAIDGEEFLTHANNDELGGTLYFWTAVTLYSGAGAYNVQDYASWNLTGGTGTAPASDPANTGLIPNGKIAAGQGFFVEAFSDGQISFDNSMRESGNNSQFFRTQNNSNEKHRIWLNLYNQTKFRQALIGYIDGATNDFDRLYDGDSFTSNEINIYSLLENRALVINGKALPFSDTDIIPIGYKVSTAGNYTISIDNLDGVFAGEQNVYLKDNLTNSIHDIKLSNYNFTTEVGTFNNRFEIVFRANALGLDNPTSTIAQAYIKDEILFINATSNIQEIILFDISGKKLATFVNDIPTNSFKTEFNYPNGVYIAKVKMDDNSIVNVKIGN